MAGEISMSSHDFLCLLIPVAATQAYAAAVAISAQKERVGTSHTLRGVLDLRHGGSSQNGRERIMTDGSERGEKGQERAGRWRGEGAAGWTGVG
eukprot:768805-Hanusia_phi.AAC.11